MGHRCCPKSNLEHSNVSLLIINPVIVMMGHFLLHSMAIGQHRNMVCYIVTAQDVFARKCACKTHYAPVSM